MWTPEQKQVVKEKVHSKILSAAWNSDGTILAVGMINGWISIRNASSDELHHIERRAPIWCLEFVPGGAPPTPPANKAGGAGSPTGGASQDSDLLVVGCWDKTLSLYRYAYYCVIAIRKPHVLCFAQNQQQRPSYPGRAPTSLLPLWSEHRQSRWKSNKLHGEWICCE